MTVRNSEPVPVSVAPRAPHVPRAHDPGPARRADELLAAHDRMQGLLRVNALLTGAAIANARRFAQSEERRELAEARADQITLAQVEDHDRIAAELHDHVVRELFALGLKLQGHVSRGDLVTAEQVDGYVSALDDIIRGIRTSIFGLRRS